MGWRRLALFASLALFLFIYSRLIKFSSPKISSGHQAQQLIENGKGGNIPEELAGKPAGQENAHRGRPNPHSMSKADEINPSSHPMDKENVNVTEADLLMSACLRYVGNIHHISYKNVFGSWDHKTDNRSEHDSLNLATKTTLSFAKVERAFHDLEVIENITSLAQAQWGVLPNSRLPPIMFVPYMRNPAHCVQDLLFSLLPMAYRGDLHGVHAVNVKWPKDDYCVASLTALGWFDEFHSVPDNTCFDKLWVPAFMHYRFPRGRSRDIEFVNNNGYLHKEDLPVEMLKFFQKEMWNGFLLNNSLLDEGKHKRILFESRRGTLRRIWKNVDEIADIIRQKLGTGLDLHIVDDVGALSMKEQADLFHSASVLVTPHSGSNP